MRGFSSQFLDNQPVESHAHAQVTKSILLHTLHKIYHREIYNPPTKSYDLHYPMQYDGERRGTLIFRRDFVLADLVLQITLALTFCSNGASASTPSTTVTISARHAIEKTMATEPKGCTNDYEIPCPVGFFYKSNCCRCGDYPSDIIKCGDNNLCALDCFCVTFNNFTRIVSVGACIFNCGIQRKNELYYTIEKEAEKVNMLCTIRGRTGTLCGEYLPNHYPLAYSFNMSCITCPQVHWNWGRYIMAAYLPLTLFSFFIFFEIRATNNVILTFCQSCSIPVVAIFVLYDRNYRVIVILWRPFRILFSLFR